MLSACFCRVWLLVQNHSWLIAGLGDGAACLRQAITQLCLSSWRDAKALQDKHDSFLLTITCHLGIQELHALGYKLLYSALGCHLLPQQAVSSKDSWRKNTHHAWHTNKVVGSHLALSVMSSANSETLCFLWDVSNFKFSLTRSDYLEILNLLDPFNPTCLFGSSLVHFFEFGSWLFKRKKSPSGGGHAQSPAHRWSNRPKKHMIWRLKRHRLGSQQGDFGQSVSDEIFG